jgi:hypothetical protein
MSTLASVRALLAKWRRREREAYAEERGFANPKELEEVKDDNTRSWAGSRALADQFGADQERPRY